MLHLNLDQKVDRIFFFSAYNWVLPWHLLTVLSPTPPPRTPNQFDSSSISKNKRSLPYLCWWVYQSCIETSSFKYLHYQEFLVQMWFLTHKVKRVSHCLSLIYAKQSTSVQSLVTQHSLELNSARHGRCKLCSSSTPQKCFLPRYWSSLGCLLLLFGFFFFKLPP